MYCGGGWYCQRLRLGGVGARRALEGPPVVGYEPEGTAVEGGEPEGRGLEGVAEGVARHAERPPSVVRVVCCPHWPLSPCAVVPQPDGSTKPGAQNGTGRMY